MIVPFEQADNYKGAEVEIATCINGASLRGRLQGVAPGDPHGRERRGRRPRLILRAGAVVHYLREDEIHSIKTDGRKVRRGGSRR